MNILVTGGAGRVGSELVKLLRDDHRVTHFEVKDPGDGLPFTLGDLRDAAAVEAACCGMDAVIHLAAVFNGADKKWDAVGDEAAFQINVTGTRNILDGAVKAGVKRVVFTSTVMTDGCYVPSIRETLPATEARGFGPTDCYGMTKALGEAMCRYYGEHRGISTIVLRPGPIFPPESYKSRVWNQLFCSVHATDIAQAHALAVTASESLRHEVFTITSDSPLNSVDPKVYQADPLGTLEALFPGMGAELSEDQKNNFSGLGWFSIEKAKALLGYDPQFNFIF